MVKKGGDVGGRTAAGGAGRRVRWAVVACVALLMLASSGSGRDTKKLDPEETVSHLGWWNDDSVKRVWGCDPCAPGDLACSLGSAIAADARQAYCSGAGLMDNGCCGTPLPDEYCFHPEIYCGYWDKPADYYGYLDVDDDKGPPPKGPNPLFEWTDGYWDTKYDFESGIPADSIVNDTVKSIWSNISGYFVRESIWKRPPFWMHINDPGPWGKNVDMQRWIMPCDAEGKTMYVCKWEECKQKSEADCPCSSDCSVVNCNVAGAEKKCYKYGGKCYEDSYGISMDPSTCNPPEGSGYVSNEADGKPGDWCCWRCKPRNVPDDGKEPKAYCGWGGVEVEHDSYDNKLFNYSDYPETEDRGNNINDDEMWYYEPFVSETIWGTMLPSWIPDKDMVRDRYWKHNATNKEFYGTRPGYCYGEGYYNTELCQESPHLRDDWERPTNKQHDPNLNPCHHWLWPVDGYAYCPHETFNYDLRYYRQFNLDSVWANIFKIVPEVNYPYTNRPPRDDYPDVYRQCLTNQRGKYVCSMSELGEACGVDDDCIAGMVCTGSLLAPEADKHCCPGGTYYLDNCCREEDNHACTDITASYLGLECPVNARVTEDKWGELNDPPNVYKVKENMKGLKRGDWRYLLGIGEAGCEGPEDCMEYMDPDDYTLGVVQHCSMAVSAKGPLKRIVPNHCCPTIDGQVYEYDLTHRCCMPVEVAVVAVSMHYTIEVEGEPRRIAYCEEKKLETGSKCIHGEGACREKDESGNAAHECEGDDADPPELVCTMNRYVTDPLNTACCKVNETWDGRDCNPINKTNPWFARWTRTQESGGGASDQQGGGSIYIYSAAGATLPNGTEAAGWDAIAQGRLDDRWKTQGAARPLRGGDFWKWPPSTDHGEFNCRMNEDGFDSTTGEYCIDCFGAWPYRTPPAPIWFDARNFGNAYKWADYMHVCNGPFLGVDATILPFDSLHEFHNPRDLECWTGDCNCGRDMDQNGDRADGKKADPAVSYCVNPWTCNQLQTTACFRGPDDPKTVHECNIKREGHGSFMPIILTNDTPVDPKKTHAETIVPETCGRIERKEVVPNSDRDKYYPSKEGIPPWSWFDYWVYELDENGAEVGGPHEFLKKSLKRETIVPRPAAPYTILRADVLKVDLSQSARKLRVEMNYTLHDRVIREEDVKTCSWLGCSRLEEIVIKYQKFHCEQNCDCSWSCTQSVETSGPPPCCCQPDEERPDTSDPFACEPPGAGGMKPPGADDLCPMTGGECDTWACKPDTTQDCDGDGVPEALRRVRESHNCTCDYACWGCWHEHGQDTKYPVTKTVDGGEQMVYEEINDTSTVTARPYGEGLLVENAIDSGSPSVKTTITGRIVYNYSNAPDYAMGYLTFVSEDAESLAEGVPAIDMFGGMDLTIPKVIGLELHTKKYPVLHELSVLQSTLPIDYFRLSADEAYRMALNRKVYKRSAGPQNVVNPFYLRWVYNPAKKHLQMDDLFAGHGTKYNWETPIMLFDLADTYYVNYFDEKSDIIGVYRNFHEDEPNYYDYESVQMEEQDIEADLQYAGGDSQAAGNVKPLLYRKPAQEVYARQAPACDDYPQDMYSLIGCASCPDMCSAVAEVYCNGGSCDCRYKGEFADLYPIPKEVCQETSTTKTSDLFRCEGPPGRYKSFCADGMYYAFFMDEFQFTYGWDSGGGTCNVNYIKECDYKELPPKSYTVVFEPAATLSKADWNNATLRVYQNFWSAVVDPFGKDSPCDEPVHTASVGGGIELTVEKPRPVRFLLQKTGSGSMVIDGETYPTVIFTVKEQDMCDGTLSASAGAAAAGRGASIMTEKKSILVQFYGPYYAQYTRWVSVGDTIEVPLHRGTAIRASLKSVQDAGFMKTVSSMSFEDTTYGEKMCGFFTSNIWFVLIAFAAVMAYRFFSGRVTDFKDMWDEYQGKK
jgi:hypothetical protein